MSAAPIIAVYDGTKCLGHIRERDREHVARTWPEEILLGSFKSRREAADAITAVRSVELATAARDWEFMGALKKAAAPPAPPPRLTARQQQVRELKRAAGLFDDLEGSA
jgi:hypothetical protein